ncbi:hypothetical protein I4U23_001798 [Adineta vaga]|nr:hypothetical protein I4U23_001798 [Adineta vaga]
MSTDTIKSITNVFPVNRDALKSPSDSRRAASIIKEFSLNTSTHGIPGIARSESVHNRMFWSISLLIFTGIMIFFVTQSIRAYFEYPSQTSVAIVNEWPQAFPAVTICNYSPLRYDRFIEPFLNYTKTFNLLNITDIKNFTSKHALYIRDFLIYKLNQNESLDEYFYSLESMMMHCSFNNILCTAANFTWFISPQYGLCYTFNAKLKDSLNSPVKDSATYGGTGILEIRLYVHQHQYVPYFSNGIGVAALVHDNQLLPDMELTPMHLAPNRHHRLGYSKKTSYFLSSPYTSCSDKVNLGMQVMYNEYHDTEYGYKQTVCYAVCIQAYTYDKCGCGNPFRWTIRYIVSPGSDKWIRVLFCNMSDPCYVDASAELLNTRSIWTKYCPACQQECTYNEFIIRLTSVYAPPAYLMNDIKQFVESTDVPLPINWSTTWPSEIQLSYVSFEVAYETSRSEVYSQQPTISAVDVLSNVGGQTGLWIGISFLSLMEIAEMIYRLIRSQYHKFHGPIQKNTNEENSQL